MISIEALLMQYVIKSAFFLTYAVCGKPEIGLYRRMECIYMRQICMISYPYASFMQ